MIGRSTPLWLSVLIAAGCSVGQAFEPPHPELARMKDQARVDSYEASDLFDDGRAMRQPPSGVIAWGTPPRSPMVAEGQDQTGYANRIPIPVDMAMIERGQDRFDVICATCHGPAGDGRSPVADKMPLIRPRSLHEQRIREYPPGRLYEVVSHGFGLMPDYSYQLSVEDRWAVVAYVQALQLSRHAPVASMPPELRQEAGRNLP